MAGVCSVLLVPLLIADTVRALSSGAPAFITSPACRGPASARGKGLSRPRATPDELNDRLGDFPAYNNAGGDDPGGGTPALRKSSRSSNEYAYAEFDGVWSRQSLSSFGSQDMTPELKGRIYNVMLTSFDELRPDLRQEPGQVEKMLDLLWSRGPTAGKQGDSLKRLVELTRSVELIEEQIRARKARRAAAAQGSQTETKDADALDDEEDRLDAVALQNARARVLVYAKDGYMYDPSKLAFYTSFLFGFVPYLLGPALKKMAYSTF